MSWRSTLGIAFLAVQAVLVVHAQFVPARWLCWAPNDYAVEYQLNVKAHGRELNPAEIQARYHVADRGWYENPAANIMDIVRQYEATAGSKDMAMVRLTYRLDGGGTKEWQWPEQR
ncbi:MAG TPA: hypothetical protein VKY31_02155 [Terriglobia bacterium]|nr:hypothetical protein [Terriglobia bacterium]